MGDINDDWGDDPLDDDWDDDADDELPEGTVPTRHGMILLDCNSSMFEACLPDPNDEGGELVSPMDLALKNMEAWVRTMLREAVVEKTGKRDSVGVLLYNTKPRIVSKSGASPASKQQGVTQDDHDEADSDSDEEDDDRLSAIKGPSNVHEFIPLEPPGQDTVKLLKNVQDDDFIGRKIDLEAEYSNNVPTSTTASTTPLAAALAMAARELYKMKKPNDVKTVWILSNDSNPCPSEGLQNVVNNSLEDLQKNGIHVSFWPLPTKHGAVDTAVCWDQFGGLDIVWDEGNALLASEVWKQERRAFGLPLLLPDSSSPDDAHIMLDFFRAVKEHKLPPPVKVSSQTGRALTRVTQLITKGGGEILSETYPGMDRTKLQPGISRLRRFVVFGGERVYWTLEEVASLKKQSNAVDFASLLLLGFRPADAIPFWHTLEHGYLCYPNDTIVSGSKNAFAALHASMVRKKVVAIGEMLARATATSRLVAIWPIEEKYNVDAMLVQAPGLFVATLPFEDDMRTIEPDAAARAATNGALRTIVTDETVDAAENLLNKLTVENLDIGTHFANAHLSQFWSYVEGVAFNESMACEEYDTLMTDKKKAYILAIAGPEIEALKTTLPEDVVVNVKRKKEERESKPDESGVDWAELWKQGEAVMKKKTTIPQLQSFLRSCSNPSESVSGKKDDLVYRVYKRLERDYTDSRETKKVKEEQST